MTAQWRSDIDSLAFRPTGHSGQCVVHRRAFRVILGKDAVPARCLAFFVEHSDRFEAAAAEKIARAGLGNDANFHLDSRDVRGRRGGAQRGESGGCAP
jgi:hypothetical protein